MDEVDALSREEMALLVRDLLQVNAEQQDRIRRLEEEIVRLRGGDPPSAPPRTSPAFVKPNRKAKETDEPKPPRKQRPDGFTRQREEPTRVIEHRPKPCSVCGHKLSDGWLHASRQVIEIPVVPYEVIEHRFMAGYCGVCKRREFARPDLSSSVVGKSRLGVGLMSLIGYLDTVCRLPIAGIRHLLAGLYRLHLSEGAIVRVLHTLARSGEAIYAGLLCEARQSGVLHADETGARENGQNGYLWCMSTSDVRLYHRDQSRGAAVIQELLGHDPAIHQARSGKRVQEKAREAAATCRGAAAERFHGVLVSDFYGGYSWYGTSGGWHQCCLVHLARDLKALKEDHADDADVGRWVERVRNLLARAKAAAEEHRAEPGRFDLALRRKRRRAFEEEMQHLARPYCRSALPQRVLAERLIKHRSELFVFVQHPDVPADNNAAERAIRPFVVLRKISGGTRSPAGSYTQSVLLSLFSTWQLRGLDALQQCQRMLTTSPNLAAA